MPAVRGFLLLLVFGVCSYYGEYSLACGSEGSCAEEGHSCQGGAQMNGMSNEELFSMMDTNKDGKVDKKEFAAHHKSNHHHGSEMGKAKTEPAKPQ